MFSFFSKQKTAFGLDISDTSLRMMQLEFLKQGFFPKAFSDVKLSPNILHGDQIQNPDALSRLIRQSWLNPTFGKMDSPYVVFSVPESKSFVRVISVPKMTEKEAQEAVPFEAEQYIPISLDQVYLDFRFLPSAAAEGLDKMRVIICAAPKPLVESYIEVVKKAGLKPVAVEVESEAVVRALIGDNLKNEPVLILDMDAFHTSLMIFDANVLQFTSSMPVAGSSLTNQLAQKMTISPDQAEKMKRQVGLVTAKDGGKTREILSPLLDSLVDAVINTINFYREHSEGDREIKKILLCGGASKLKGLPEYLNQNITKKSADKVMRDVEIGDPWVNVLQKHIVKIPPISKNDSVSFTTVIGLALRGSEME